MTFHDFYCYVKFSLLVFRKTLCYSVGFVIRMVVTSNNPQQKQDHRFVCGSANPKSHFFVM